MNWAIIEEIRKQKGISKKDLAKNSGLSEEDYTTIIEKEASEIETIERIAKNLGVSAALFFEDKNFESKTDFSGYRCPFCIDKERIIKILELNNNSLETLKIRFIKKAQI